MNTHDIYIDWEFPGTNPYKPLLTRVIAAALEAEGVRIPCGVDVLLTDDEGIREINREQREVDSVTDVLSFPMLNLTPGTPPDGTGEEEHDPEIDALVAARTEAKRAKNWPEADRIRDELKARGIEVIDTPQGAKWKRI